MVTDPAKSGKSCVLHLPHLLLLLQLTPPSWLLTFDLGHPSSVRPESTLMLVQATAPQTVLRECSLRMMVQMSSSASSAPITNTTHM